MSALFLAPVAPVVAPAPERRVRPTAPVRVSSRTRWGFRSPQRSLPKTAGGLQVALLDVAGGFAFDSPVVPVVPAPVVAIPAPVAPVPVAASPAALEAPVAPAPAPAPKLPAGAASVRVAPVASAFRVEVVDLDTDEVASVVVSAASASAARRECSDEFALPVAVFAVLPGGAEELVWGEAA